MPKERISFDMSIQDMLFAMSDGNPGALTVLMNLVSNEASIDPDCALVGIGSILGLDSCGIYGSRIWCLFKDVAGQDLRKTIGLLRAVQLGFLSNEDLDVAIDNYGRGVEVDKIISMVEDRLPNFMRGNKV